MPNVLAISAHPSAAETVSGVGTAVDLGDRTYVTLVSNATVMTSATTLIVTAETSLTNVDWTAVGTFATQSGISAVSLLIPVCSRYLRVRWAITGSAPSVTFAVTGAAYQLYAHPADLVTFGMPAVALARFSAATQAAACLASSDEAAGYLASAYTLPIVSWDQDLRKAVACLAVYDLLSSNGYEPDSGKDSVVETRRNNSVSWLKRVADGGLRPPGIVDTTPVIRETEVQVVSWQSRGWRGWGC